jgi:hypothetical protein
MGDLLVILTSDHSQLIYSTPQKLSFNSYYDELSALWDGLNLRQVIAPETFVDIERVDQYE